MGGMFVALGYFGILKRALVSLWCPKGHRLQQSLATCRGSCNWCGREVHEGEQVMECQPCNWWACKACRRTDTDMGKRDTGDGRMLAVSNDEEIPFSTVSASIDMD